MGGVADELGLALVDFLQEGDVVEDGEDELVGAVVEGGEEDLVCFAADTVSQGQSAKKSQDLALTLKQDIARRQWEKKIDLSWMDNYMQGTLEK